MSYHAETVRHVHGCTDVCSHAWKMLLLYPPTSFRWGHNVTWKYPDAIFHRELKLPDNYYVIMWHIEPGWQAVVRVTHKLISLYSEYLPPAILSVGKLNGNQQPIFLSCLTFMNQGNATSLQSQVLWIEALLFYCLWMVSSTTTTSTST